MTIQTTCLTCELIARRDRGQAPAWDSIHRSKSWDLVHAFNTSLPGWLVLVARRHVEAIDELTEKEAAELGVLLRRASAALRDITGCTKTYVMQFAEAEGHGHVHFHIVPRLADQPEDRRSAKIFGYLGVSEEERVSEVEMNKIAERVRDIMAEQGESR
jgi:diadenosine tetraphosphate (Ap4A) HIT family hydrolase